MVTRKCICGLFGLAIFVGTIVVFGGIKEASSELNVGINFSLGSSPPQEVVMVPSGVYFVPDQSIDVFFYSGYWWATRDSKWYRSRDYNGAWRVVDRRYVPAPVHHIYEVPNYREVYVKHDGRRIPYGQWKKNGHREIVQENRGNQPEHTSQVIAHESSGNPEEHVNQGNPGNQENQKIKSKKGNKHGRGN